MSLVLSIYLFFYNSDADRLVNHNTQIVTCLNPYRAAFLFHFILLYFSFISKPHSHFLQLSAEILPVFDKSLNIYVSLRSVLLFYMYVEL